MAEGRDGGVGNADGPLIDILLCTRNGARFLAAQLASYLAQTHANWALWVSDDGSDDGTQAVLAAFRAAHPDRQVTLLQGPGRGAAANFLTLLAHPGLSGGLVALSDQDDVWLPHKLTRAVAWISREPAEVPVAYGARTILADEGLRAFGTSPLHRRPTGFRNAFVQNILGGNSTVLNRAALRLVRNAGVPRVFHHDWWIYLLVTGAGGRVLIDPEPVLIYRQHGANVLGTNAGVTGFTRRLRQVLGPEYRKWMRANARALTRAADLLTPENRAALAAYRQALRSTGPGRARAMWRTGFRRQTGTGTALMLLAAMLNRL